MRERMDDGRRAERARMREARQQERTRRAQFERERARRGAPDGDRGPDGGALDGFGISPEPDEWEMADADAGAGQVAEDAPGRRTLAHRDRTGTGTGPGLVYEGPSEFNGRPVVAVLTTGSRNPKTGPMDQLWIMPRDVQPGEAVKVGRDRDVCGGCALRPSVGGEVRCYVQPWMAPLAVWEAHQLGSYQRIAPDELGLFGEGRDIRLGAWGDPAALPVDVVADLVSGARSWTGYTHAWRRPASQRLREWCHASVEDEAGAVTARRLGWRTFRVRRPGGALMLGEVQCPASAEAGNTTTCQRCLRCGGREGKGGPGSVSIEVHGSHSPAAWVVRP